VVWTSSTSNATAGAGPVVRTRGGEARRAARVRPTWRGPSALDRQRSCGRRVSAASCEAISSAGSKPRRSSREVAGGTGTMAPQRICSGASSAIPIAIRCAAGSRRRNFSATTSSLATPSWGAEAQTASSPGSSGAAGGRVASSDAWQRRQRNADPAQLAPQAVQRGGASSERSWRNRSIGPIVRRKPTRVARQSTREAPRSPPRALSQSAWRRSRRRARFPARSRCPATSRTP
jgi:hypothetical protein